MKLALFVANLYLWLVNIFKKHPNKITNRLRRWLYKLFFQHIRNKVPPKLYPTLLIEWYWYKTRGKNLDLNNPLTISEKLQWLKLNDISPLKTRLADKYLVREWVSNIIGKEYIVSLLGAWDKYDDIDFSSLPQQFVLKTNHACATNIIITDKNKINHDKNRKKFSKWLNMNYAFDNGFELQYKNIPRKIIAEKYLPSDSNGRFYDYRFFCCNGNVVFYRITQYFHSDIKGYGFDLEKKLIPMGYESTDLDHILRINETADIDTMLKLSETLAQGFLFVRVDWYEVEGKPYFGEMTFTPKSGILDWGDALDRKLGDELTLPIG